VRVDGLGTVIVAKQILPGSEEDRVFLQVVSPIRDGDGIAGLLGCFDGVLINGGIDQAKVVDDLGSLEALAGPQSFYFLCSARCEVAGLFGLVSHNSFPATSKPMTGE
jgi:hypothetical protein